MIKDAVPLQHRLCNFFYQTFKCLCLTYSGIQRCWIGSMHRSSCEPWPWLGPTYHYQLFVHQTHVCWYRGGCVFKLPVLHNCNSMSIWAVQFLTLWIHSHICPSLTFAPWATSLAINYICKDHVNALNRFSRKSSGKSLVVVHCLIANTVSKSFKWVQFPEQECKIVN